MFTCRNCNGDLEVPTRRLDPRRLYCSGACRASAHRARTAQATEQKDAALQLFTDANEARRSGNHVLADRLDNEATHLLVAGLQPFRDTARRA